ncbi:hypothetical protein X742_22730 [Mesorhizobium sp. LNHC232B00]|nr:hypothetical protein X742_22730 [Mesorhizobium sp. LNHC232B00]
MMASQAQFPSQSGNFGLNSALARLSREVSPVMGIARPYKTKQEALQIANNSIYGIRGYVSAKTTSDAANTQAGLRAARISFNGPNTNSLAPI